MPASRRRALIVATGMYDDPKLRRLRAPAADAQQLEAVLHDAAIGDFEVDIAQDCDERELRRRIARFFQSSGRDDVLLMHVSGHGIKDARGALFLAASDTELDLLDATAISAAWLDEQMTQSPSRRKLMLLDCCFSGKFPFGSTARAGGSVDVEERLHGRGRAVITASNSMEYAYEGDRLSGEGQPSYFTAAVVEALQTGEADRDQDGWISVDELYEHVYEQVKERSPNQTPNKQIALQGPLYVARSTYKRPIEPATLDRQLLDLLEHSYPGARLGAVEELAGLLKASNPSVALAARQALERTRNDDSDSVKNRVRDVLGEEPEAKPAEAFSGTTGVGSREEPATSTPPDRPRRPHGLKALLTPRSGRAIIGASVAVTAVAGFAGHELAWTIGQGVEIGSTAPGTASGAIYTGGRFLLPMAALAFILVAAGRNRSGAAVTVAASAILGALVLGSAMFYEFNTDRLGLMLVWTLRGATIGAFALLGTRAKSPVGAAAASCAVAGAVWGLVGPEMRGSEQTMIILVRTVLPLALLAAVAGAVMARVSPAKQDPAVGGAAVPELRGAAQAF